MIEKDKQLRVLFKMIEKLESSDSSTMTDLSVCKDLISQKFDINLTYIDICCGKGTILLCLYLEFWKRLDILNVEEKNKYIIDRLCGVDISKAQASIAKKALKKVQKIFGIQNILEPIVYNIDILSYDENKYKIMKKFDVVITNPPYNSERGDNNQSVDIYPEIVDKAFELTNRYVIMITKSNWMNFPSHKKFREKMINGYNVDKIVHYSKNPFKDTSIQGGVSYFVIDNENTKKTFELNGVTYDRATALHFLPYELNNKELLLLDKIIKLEKMDLSNYRPKGYYDVKSNDKRLSNTNNDDSVICHVSELKGKTKYFKKCDFNQKIISDFDKYKVFTSSSGGNKSEGLNVLGRVFSGHKEVNTESLVNWVFNTEKESIDFLKYFNSKLFRVCVSMIKSKMDVSKVTFSLIPHINLNELDIINDENIFEYLKKNLNFTDDDIKTINDRCDRLNLFKIK